MRFRPLTAVIGTALALAAGGCTEPDANLAQVSQTVCSNTILATAPMPGASQWYGKLPGDVAGAAAQQVWLFEAVDGSATVPPTSYRLYQVDTVGMNVRWRANLTAAQRETAVGQTIKRNGITVQARLPPPPPWPPIDGWLWADGVLNGALMTRWGLEHTP